MLAEVNEEYFIKLIDKPKKAYIKSGPNRFTIVCHHGHRIDDVCLLVAFLSIFNRKILLTFSLFNLKSRKINEYSDFGAGYVGYHGSIAC